MSRWPRTVYGGRDDFLFEGRPGVYFLGPYDRTRIPVLFVHGISGTPRHFATLIEGLDTRRFQPWVYYYPSGTALAGAADHLTQTMRKLQIDTASSRSSSSPTAWVASWRAASCCATVRAVEPQRPAVRLDFHAVGRAQGRPTRREVTDSRARLGRPVAGQRDLRSLYARDPGVPHDLIFSFRNEGVAVGEASDGTVSVASQLKPAVQAGAVRVDGFNETHMGVLKAPAVSERLNKLLSAVGK